MEKNYFLTITGVNYCYGMKPFEVGRVIKLVKEPDNDYDAEAIRAELPYIDKIGYVANSPNTVAKGTFSAGRVYDLFENETLAQILFVTHASVICLLISLDGEDKGTDTENTQTAIVSGETTEPRAQYEKVKIQIGFQG